MPRCVRTGCGDQNNLDNRPGGVDLYHKVSSFEFIIGAQVEFETGSNLVGRQCHHQHHWGSPNGNPESPMGIVGNGERSVD